MCISIHIVFKRNVGRSYVNKTQSGPILVPCMPYSFFFFEEKTLHLKFQMQYRNGNATWSSN
jgi:hypothetical protein